MGFVRKGERGEVRRNGNNGWEVEIRGEGKGKRKEE
jgi:hypothetical protein